MERKQIFENYMSTHSAGYTDFSKDKLRLQFNSYNRNYATLLPNNKEASILEIGFGSGYFIKYLLSRGYTNIHGIELSDEEAKFVKKFIYDNDNIDCVESTENFLDENINKYDFIYMSQVLEHIPKDNVIDLLVKIKNSLKDSGIFVANTPNINNPFNIKVSGGDFTHEFIFNPESLRQVCMIANFYEIKILPFKEENITWHGKVTNIVSKISYFFTRIIIGLNRCYLSPSNIYSANIYCVCKK